MAAPTPPPGGNGNWWVVPEGILGDILNALSNFGATRVHYHVVQSATQPNAQSSGPYGTRAQAQAQADQLNSQRQPLTVTTNVSNAVTSSQFLGKLGDPHLWLRVAEVAIGVILLAVAVNALLKQSTGTSLASVVPAGRALKAVS